MTAPDPTTCPHCYHHPHVYPGRPPQAFSYRLTEGGEDDAD